MRTSLLALGLVLGVGLAPAGCKKKDEKKADDKVEPAPVDPVPTPDPAGDKVHGSGTGGGQGSGSGSGVQEMTNKMMHCPSAVEGSVTKVQLNKGAVVVTVTAGDKDKAKVAEIQKRAKHLASLNGPTASPEVKHSGQGTGGGALGKCPVMIKDAVMAVEDQKDGAKFVLTAKDPGKLAEIGKTAQDRAEALAAARPAGEEGEDDEAADEE
jgi:hypothetical protein